mgnify:CR=1 FL=1
MPFSLSRSFTGYATKVQGSYCRKKETNVKKLLLLGMMLMIATTGCAKEKGADAAGKGNKKDANVVATVGSFRHRSHPVSAA